MSADGSSDGNGRAALQPDDGSDRPARVEDRFDWRNPAYSAVLQARLERLRRIREHPEQLPALRAYYRTHIADWINDWGMTYDPRPVSKDRPSDVPFVLFPKQRAWVDFTFQNWRDGEYGGAEKSRDVGLSWLSVAFSVALCTLYDRVAVGLGSFKQEKVDWPGEMGSLFEKARYFTKNLPVEFRGGFDSDTCSTERKMLFPATGGTIIGEIGDNVGRGGRAQPLDSKILTPSGWMRMGDLTVGQYVIGANGKRTRVVGIYPRGTREVFRVRFSDGASTECCDEHLWKVTTSAMRKASRRSASKWPWAVRHAVLPLSHIRTQLMKPRADGQTEWRYQVPILSSPVEFEHKELPVDPYIVGCLLGDGSLGHIDKTSPTITLHEDDLEIVGYIDAKLPMHCGTSTTPIKNSKGVSVRLIDKRGARGRGHRSPIKESLIEIGLAGMHGRVKRVPDLYKFASPEQRLELLRGLLDTDGWISWKNRSTPRIKFCSISKQLIADLIFIVQSLGGTARAVGKIVKAGRIVNGGNPLPETIAQEVSLCLPSGINPFKLRRKAARVSDRIKYKPSRSIVSVENIGMRETQCIAVDAPDHLYVTDDCVVTHNTSIYFVDEAAYFEHDMIVDMALSKNTPCRQDLSSVRGMKNTFAQRMHDGHSRKFTFHWRDNPLFTQEDYDKFRKQWGPVVTAQELDIDYQASVEGVIIPQEHIQAAVDAHVKLAITPSGVKRGALDVADEGRDLNAFAARHGILLTHCEAWSGKGSDLFATAERAINRCDDWLLDGFDYDADGLGAGIRGDAARIVARRNASRMRGIRIAAYRGSEKVFDPEAKAAGTDVKNVDRYQNAKAQSWASLAHRFYNTFRAVSGGDYDPDNIISLSSSIPDLSKLCIELSQPQWKISATGKLQVDKTPDGMASPNHADAVCILFRVGQKPFKISDAAIAMYGVAAEEMM